jgi:hypothetical protein
MPMLTTSAMESNEQPVALAASLDKGGGVETRGATALYNRFTFLHGLVAQSNVARWQIIDVLRGGIITAS